MAKSGLAGKKTLIGSWAFLIGVILAVIFGFIGMNSTIATILMVIGLIVGLLNINDKEVMPFLLSGAVLVIVGYFGQNAFTTVTQISDILSALMAIFVPATIIVAIKNVFSLAKN